MTAFASPLDIANRALQRCGVSRIRTTDWPPSEDSKQASELLFLYDKIRRAELRRNAWRHAVRRATLRPLDTTVMLLNPVLWDGGTTYGVGSIVADGAGLLWGSNSASNTGNPPGQSRHWSSYFGPLTVTKWDATTSYDPGELAYTTSGNGGFTVYASVAGGNTDAPGTPQDWAAATTYNAQAIVSYGGANYQNLFDANTGNRPDLSPLPWAPGTTYASGALVGGSDGAVYSSVASGNTGHDPVGNGGANWTATGALQPWTTALTLPAGSANWRQLTGAAVQSISIVYPAGTGPMSERNSANVFLLPNGYLRTVPQNPPGGPTWLGGPSGNSVSDWQFEGDFLLSSRPPPIRLRFVADVTDVASMDDMFCEGLACRIAAEACETLTQGTAKLASINMAYKMVMGEARIVNAIEMGADEPPEVDYVAVRY